MQSLQHQRLVPNPRWDERFQQPEFDWIWSVGRLGGCHNHRAVGFISWGYYHGHAQLIRRKRGKPRFFLEAAGGAPPTNASAAAGARSLVALMILGCAVGVISMLNSISCIGWDIILVTMVIYPFASGTAHPSTEL
jgi:hypothetical protein